ncbi:MAG TPA: hypothetical protein PKC62_02975 [Ferruginibacter sp.]|jgi:hypothetical protein|nr:hypothetical protein [Bacteroidota bacterium]MBS1924731.1 hypothetical protein [Bacteroidota bacterium]MCC6692027.1 hypothetical protein [Chitinophagaceae bacterium]HMT95625.1 hypothetical protein [Ferruginibacter sp.]HMU23902.1 hypothetical protein [Ferruginibacter sp.]
MGIFAWAENAIAQQNTFKDEELWYLERQTWMVVALVGFLVLLAFYLKFKPKKVQEEKPESNRTSQSPPESNQTASEVFDNKST